MSHHICGCYYILPSLQPYYHPKRHYLPQVSVKAHTTILATTSRTSLTQTFVNPSKSKGIKELRYTFPLYDGVSVVGFTCRIGDRVIVGEVKEKDKARAVFKAAVDAGQTAGLLEQLPDASDVFTTTIGNVPPGAIVLVDITYLGELKHDAEVDGIRFTIPTSISPRYGSYPGELAKSDLKPVVGRGFEVTVDAVLGEGSWIRELRSPSHPIAVSVGTTSAAPNADPQTNKASATLSLGSAELENDFVLQVVAKETSIPKAILETHPTIPNQRALMATLVPKFALPPERPEIVFVCDRSGSMSGANIVSLRNALKVFLKSLPVGVKFNICSFGSSYSFLWSKSKSYSQNTLEEAMNHVETFQANYGGTEMFEPIKETLKRRFSDLSLEVFLVTDGEIWDQQRLFTFLNDEVIVKKAPIRVFTLGIGDGASSSLIEGVARAGNGFSQTVGNNEKLDSKVVRMLKGGLSPHINDYSIEVKYGADHELDDDDFEILEKVVDSLKIHVDSSENDSSASDKVKKPISLFDTSANPDADTPKAKDDDGLAKFSHLPIIDAPKMLQAPNAIPPLFAFSRTSVYLLLSPAGTQRPIKSVVLRGTSSQGPLELEIPVQTLDEPGQTIHQLAAKKAVHELEQGRGWIYGAKDQASGKLIKEKHPGRFDDMVEREAVRLGVQFQVGGKFCSFVAVEKKKSGEDPDGDTKMDEKEYEFVEDDADATTLAGDVEKEGSRMRSNIDALLERGERLDSLVEKSAPLAASQARSFSKAKKSAGYGGGLFSSVKSAFGSSAPPPRPSAAPMSFGAPASMMQQSAAFGAPPPPPSGGVGLFGSTTMSNSSSLFSARSRVTSPTGGLFGAAAPAPGRGGGHSVARDGSAVFSAPAAKMARRSTPSPQMESRVSHEKFQFEEAEASEGEDDDMGFGLDDDGTSPGAADLAVYSYSAAAPDLAKGAPPLSLGSACPPPAPKVSMFGRLASSTQKAALPTDPLQALIELQTFEGFWNWNKELCAVLGIDSAAVEKAHADLDKKVLATVLAVRYFEVKLRGEKDSWELLVEKAKGWLESVGHDEDAKVWEDTRSIIV